MGDTESAALEWLAPALAEPLALAGGPGLDALRLDGLVREVWPGVLQAADLAAGAAERMDAVAGRLPPSAVLARRSAVWVLTGRLRPDHLDVVLTGSRRRSSADLCVHSERLATVDVVELGPGRCTSPARTLVDIARCLHGVEARACLAAMGSLGVPSAEVVAALQRAAGTHGVIRARGVLAGYPSLDDYW